MSIPFSEEQLAPLKIFIEYCKKDPQILHEPQLGFVKEFIEYLGGKIPNEKAAEETEDADEESDLEFDMTGVIEPDSDTPQQMGDLSLEPTSEQIAEAESIFSSAGEAFSSKNYEKALAGYTEAILLNPHLALLYGKRGQVYLQVSKPNACIRDCSRAIELNPDNAAAHKYRGRAYQLLGKWEEAASDLRLACQLDFNDQADEWLREVTPNARKIEEHKRKKERMAREKKEKSRQEGVKKQREAPKPREADARPSQTHEGAKKPDLSDYYDHLDGPEVQAALQDQEISAALADILSNPVNILKYQGNPKIMTFLEKAASKIAAATGAGEQTDQTGKPTTDSSTKPSAPSANDDVGLD
ncbi:putative protein FAM10A4 [Diachasmimorpha longicaudata]|uniref:putative protein FAM10A4 n=1 Tax=Diachasmimorpha longicaudata TaxID=58733 RepID=UPI0030B8985D